MYVSRRLRGLLLGSTGCLLAIIYIPIILVAAYAFNPSRSQTWPIQGLTLQWINAVRCRNLSQQKKVLL